MKKFFPNNQSNVNNQSENAFSKIPIVKIVLLFFIIASILFSYNKALSEPVSSYADKSIVINVTPGMSTNAIGQMLYDEGLINNLTVFKIATKIQGLESSLQAGEYIVTPTMSIKEIIIMLSNGKVVVTKLTIPEGYTVEQIATLLEKDNIGKKDKFLELAKNYKNPYLTEENSNINYPVEGFLFPDTYLLKKNAPEEELLKTLTNQFDKNFTEEMRIQADKMGFSVYEIIILASLVEKEARFDEERPIIAAIFIKRLDLGMPLQSCATIQYLLGTPKEVLSIEDTKIESPYNTYQNVGLPPGPIGNPGKQAIDAVLKNEQTNYLYFVATREGKHLFSSSYEGHLEKIAQLENEE